MAVVASLKVEEVGAGTCYCVRGARNVFHQAGTSYSRKLSQTVHQTWGWELPKTERIPTMLTKAEVQVYHPVLVRGPDGDPKRDARQENPLHSSSFRY